MITTVFANTYGLCRFPPSLTLYLEMLGGLLSFQKVASKSSIYNPAGLCCQEKTLNIIHHVLVQTIGYLHVCKSAYVKKRLERRPYGYKEAFRKTHFAEHRFVDDFVGDTTAILTQPHIVCFRLLLSKLGPLESTI